MPTDIDYPLIVSLAAIAVMAFCFWTTLSLKKYIPGGIVGKKWRLMTSLVMLFLLGYLTTPFFGMIPNEVLRLIVALIFFFGAIYVLITIKLIHTIIRELSE